MAERYVVGIDLGTTHCAVAASPVGRAEVRLFDIPQLVAAGEVAARTLLPSFMYLPATGELQPGDTRLPWGDADTVVGDFARQRGAQVPIRLVASAKSWICHGGVNRRAPILPWSAPEDAPHVSPFEASAAYLAHLRAAWDHAHPEAPLGEQDVVVTVPASFDEVARELTADAARAAGIGQVRLLEEPQAAFYDFLGAHADDLGAQLGEAKLVLVVDVGGGTTDLTLVRVLAGGDAPELERIAVGGHLMLGGDNMDAALAHHVLQQAGIAKLDPTEWSKLVQTTRQAKERLLADDAPEEAVVSVQRRGSRLIGGTRSVTLKREDVQKVLIDGFVPFTGPEEVASRKGRAGLTTLGLPYTTDAAIPRHVNAFLRKHARAAAEAGATVVDGLPRPDLLLLNGGVFNAPALVRRLSAVMESWYGAPVRLLDHTSLDTAVACGAARHALSRRGIGQTIGGGTARAYYIAVQAEGEQRAFCVAPKGMDEGSTVAVKDRVMELVLDRPVAFRLFGYTGDRDDAAGRLVDVEAEMDPLPPLETVVRAPKDRDLTVSPSGGVPVTLAATLNETGTLELYLVTVELPPRRWRLEFNLHDAAPAEAPAPSAEPGEDEGGHPEVPMGKLPKDYPRARHLIDRVFSPGKGGADPQKARGLRRDIENTLGPRGQWSATVCRTVFDQCMAGAAQRGRSPHHEAAWLRLVGFGLRPGFGVQGDAKRLDKLWAVHEEGLKLPKNKGNWSEWWIAWRRVAPGLDRERQQALFADIQPWLGSGKRPPGPPAGGHPEMIRLLAALERLSPEQKVQAGEWFFQRYNKVRSWWPLGRLGNRAPFHGSAADVVPRAVATEWLGKVLELDWAKEDGADFAAVLLARNTGDAAVDVDPALRKQVLDRLGEMKAPMTWIEMVGKVGKVSEGDAKAVYGDALPAGLRLR